VEPEVLRASLEEAMWVNGIVGEWYLKSKQKAVLQFLRIFENPFFEASRRYGKTTCILGYVLEEGARRRIVIRWCEPWKNQCREIVVTEMDKIQSRVREEYRWKYRQTDSFYEHPTTGSRMYLRGVNEDRGESARGTASDIIVCDELGSWREPEYVIREVLTPQLLTTYGKIIYTGTPPRLLVHPFYEIKDRAVARGRFLQRLIHDQELVDAEQVEKMIEELGGWESPAVRREFLCEKIKDPKFAIIPEWDDKFIATVVPDDCFPFYYKYDGLDLGVRDKTVCILGYYDFRRTKLCLMDEVRLRGPEMTTQNLAELVRGKEQELFGLKWEHIVEGTRIKWRPVKPNSHFRIKRISDIDLRLTNDMPDQGLVFDTTDKGSLEEMVNELRLWVGAGKLEVDPKCRDTIDCLRYGMWDEDRKDWERTEALGHFDALAALMYLVRNVHREQHINPIPFDYGRPEADYWHDESQKEAKKDRLRKMFNVQNRW
jgi:hypothetical protein